VNINAHPVLARISKALNEVKLEVLELESERVLRAVCALLVISGFPEVNIDQILE